MMIVGIVEKNKDASEVMTEKTFVIAVACANSSLRRIVGSEKCADQGTKEELERLGQDYGVKGVTKTDKKNFTIIRHAHLAD